MTEDELRAACIEFAEHYDSIDDLIAFATRMQAVGLREAANHIDYFNDDPGRYSQHLQDRVDFLLAKAKEREG